MWRLQNRAIALSYEERAASDRDAVFREQKAIRAATYAYLDSLTDAEVEDENPVLPATAERGPLTRNRGAFSPTKPRELSPGTSHHGPSAAGNRPAELRLSSSESREHGLMAKTATNIPQHLPSNDALTKQVPKWGWDGAKKSTMAAAEVGSVCAAAAAFPLVPPVTLLPHDSAESTLLRRAAGGDRAAFDLLFARHKDRVYACLYQLLDGDSEQIEEAVGTVFLAAFRALPGFRGEAALSTYLFRIAVNEATRRRKVRDQLRRRESPHEVRDETTRTTVSGEMGGDESGFAGTGVGSNPEGAVVRAEEGRLLAQAVRALPEPYRTPVILRYLNDLPAVDVARILGRPCGNRALSSQPGPNPSAGATRQHYLDPIIEHGNFPETGK